jgi:hypothetical protein
MAILDPPLRWVIGLGVFANVRCGRAGFAPLSFYLSGYDVKM